MKCHILTTQLRLTSVYLQISKTRSSERCRVEAYPGCQPKHLATFQDWQETKRSECYGSERSEAAEDSIPQVQPVRRAAAAQR